MGQTNQPIDPKTLPNYGWWRGFRGATRGTEVLLRNPKLMLIMLGALLINGLIISALLWWGWGQTDGLQTWLVAQSKLTGGFGTKTWATMAGWIAYLFTALKWFMLVLVLYFVAPTMYNILLNLNPITALMVAEMFKIVFKQEAGISLPEPPFLEGLLRMIVSEVRKLLAMLTLMILALMLNIIPVAGSIASVFAMFVIGVQFSGWSYITPYYESLDYNYTQQRSAMRKQRTMIWGLGLISGIPLFNLLALFIGPVGGALLAAELHKEVTGQN